jgi:hypothetical protein
MVLDSDTEEHLLSDIERNGLPLAQVSLVDICDADLAVYGRSGNPRRPVQQCWAKIKKLTPHGYLALLKKHKIPPSPATLAAVEVKQEYKEPESKNSEPTETIDNNNELVKLGPRRVALLEISGVRQLWSRPSGHWHYFDDHLLASFV